MHTFTFLRAAILGSTLTAAALLTPAFGHDLSSLPAYKPAMQVTGLLRSRGNDQMSGVMKLWEEGFSKYHPDVRFADTLKGSSSGIYGIEMRTADMALMGRPINPFERYGTYERGWAYPVEIEVATGAVGTPHKSPAFAIFVHKDNPLAKLTMAQLDGIFGARRTGGWVALHWDDSAARGTDKDIRTWGQLGVTGPLANQPIHVYGQPNRGAGEVQTFEQMVFGGGRIWNEDLREYPDRKELIAALAADPLGIAYSALGYGTSDVKAVALGKTASGPFTTPTADSVTSREYPLARAVCIHYTLDTPHGELSETFGDPRVKEFLRYILSREGQEAVVKDGAYLPLTKAVIKKQLKKLDSTEEPPEHKVLE